MTYSHRAYDSVAYDEVTDCFSVESPPQGQVVQHATAAQRVAETPDDRVVAVAPVSLATGYRLGGMPFTAVPTGVVDDPDAVVSSAGRRLSTYDLLVCGRLPARQNHSLREYA